MMLRSLDLNLLTALEALLVEGHVTRAADRIGRSQPAMSHALRRLRALFRDDLLVRTPAGMRLTPRGEALLPRLRELLLGIERLVESGPVFTPATADRRFVLRLSDLLAILLLPPLLQRLQGSAPHLRLDVLHLSPPRTVEALAADTLDLAVSTGLEHPRDIASTALFSDQVVGMLRRDHPAAAAPLTLDVFLACRHLKVSMTPTDLRFIDESLGEAGTRREIALNLPHWLVVPHVLRRSDLVAVLPGRLAAAVTDETLAIRPLDFAGKSFEWRLYWHRRYDADPPNAWLRAQVIEVARSLAAGAGKALDGA